MSKTRAPYPSEFRQQMVELVRAEVAVLKELFRKILRLIDGLRPAPLPP